MHACVKLRPNFVLHPPLLSDFRVDGEVCCVRDHQGVCSSAGTAVRAILPSYFQKLTNSDSMELNSKCVCQPASLIGPDTPLKKPRFDEQSAPFTEDALNGWLNDNTLIQSLMEPPNPQFRLMKLVRAVDRDKPGTLRMELGNGDWSVLTALPCEQPHIKELLQAGDFKRVLQSGQIHSFLLHLIRSDTAVPDILQALTREQREAEILTAPLSRRGVFRSQCPCDILTTHVLQSGRKRVVFPNSWRSPSSPLCSETIRRANDTPAIR